MFSVYLARCRDNSLYCGYTNDLNKRMLTHNKGKGAKYTKKRRPITLIYSEKYVTKGEAMKREYQIKQLTKKEKEELVK